MHGVSDADRASAPRSGKYVLASPVCVCADAWAQRLAVKELKATGKFESLSRAADEDEHSVEMHLPYVRKIFAE